MDIAGLTRKEKMIIYLKTLGLMFFLALTFYKSVLAVVLMIPAGIWFKRYEENSSKQKKYEIMKLQFKDVLQNISADMQAGYSFTNALADSAAVCQRLYGRKCLIREILVYAVNEMNLNTPIEKALWGMAEKSGMKEVYEFADVVRITLRYGGNMPSIIRQLAVSMEGRMSITEEILAVTAATRYEAYVMDVIPAAIIWYLNLTGPVFLEVLYTTWWGRVFMTVCLVVYLLIIKWQFSMVEQGIG